jgi:Kef-type K+ transport system membrane component KefB
MLVNNILLNVGFLVTISVIGLLVLKKFNLPMVLIYIIIGMICSPSLLNLVHPALLKNDFIVTQFTLSIIAFSIGDTFLIKNLKQVGQSGVTISILQAVFTTSIVIIGLLLVKSILKISIGSILVMGAIAAATAPASTFMIIKEYKAKGVFTNFLLAAVSIDDAVGILLFDIMVIIAKTLESQTQSFSVAQALWMPVVDVGLSLAIGFSAGLLLTYFMRYCKTESQQLLLSLGFVMAAAGICIQFDFSPLLCCMALGGVFSNFYPLAFKVYDHLDRFTPPVFLLFFIISGAGLDFSVLVNMGWLGIAVIILRTIGKVYGTELAGMIAKAPKTVCRYLGLAMIPQAGVAIGFALSVKKVLPQYSFITSVVLANVVYSQIIGPLLAKHAIIRSGEGVVA